MRWDLQLPKLSATGDTATIVRWLKRPGDWVSAREVVLEIETDKATMEIEAPQAGFLAEILVQAGETAEAGAAIARFTDERPAQTASEAPTDVAPAASAPLVTPAPSSPAPGRAVSRPLSRMRRRIAEEVTTSLREIPAFWVERWVSVEALERVRGQLNASARRDGRPELTFTDFLLQATADVLPGFPSLCTRLSGASPEEWAEHRLEDVNVGLVTSLPEGGCWSRSCTTSRERTCMPSLRNAGRW